MAQVIQIKRRVPGSGSPTTLAAGELATAISAVAPAAVADLWVGDGTNPHLLVGNTRQVEMTGNQSIAGVKTFTGGVTVAPNLLHVSGGNDGDILTTDGAGNLTWELAPAGVTVGTTAPASPREGDMWFDGDVLHLWDGSDWVEISWEDPTGTGAFGRTSAGGWSGVLQLSGGALTGGLTFSGAGALTIASTVLHITGGTAGQVLSTDGAGVNSWHTVQGISVGSSAPASPGAGDMWFDDDDEVLHIYDGSTWIEVGIQEPTAAGLFGRTSAGAWQAALPISGGALTGGLTFTGAGSITVATTALHITGGAANEILVSDGAGGVSWEAAPAGGLLSVAVNAPLSGNGQSGNAIGITPATTSQVTTGTDNVYPITSLRLRDDVMGDDVDDLTTTAKLVVPAINELDGELGTLANQIAALTGALRFVGNYDADDNEVVSADAGTLTVGQPLPAAAAGNEGWFVIVTVAGTGTGQAPHVQMAIGDWIVSTGTSWIHVPLYHAAITAANVGITQIDSETWANVQQALQGLYDLVDDAITTISVDGTSMVGDGVTTPLAVGTLDGGTF